jgi:hypothetical protein
MKIKIKIIMGLIVLMGLWASGAAHANTIDVFMQAGYGSDGDYPFAFGNSYIYSEDFTIPSLGLIFEVYNPLDDYGTRLEWGFDAQMVSPVKASIYFTQHNTGYLVYFNTTDVSLNGDTLTANFSSAPNSTQFGSTVPPGSIFLNFAPLTVTINGPDSITVNNANFEFSDQPFEGELPEPATIISLLGAAIGAAFKRFKRK